MSTSNRSFEAGNPAVPEGAPSTGSSTASAETASGSARRSRSSSTARRSSSARRTAARRSSTSTQSRTRVDQVQDLAERAVLVQVGAGLVAQDNFVSTVRGLANKYSTRSGVERELQRFERSGATARNRFERQVRKTRTRFERELRHRRTSVERSFKQNRRRLEREVRSVRKDLERQSGLVGSRAQKLVANAQELIGSAS